jgi:hypothetical protein
MTNKKFRLSSARLTTLYVLIFAGGITVLLASVYILSGRVLDREVDAVIQAEVNGLIDDYRRGGLLQLISTLNLRADSWGRSGAVYLLANTDGTRVAGNIASWPTRIDANQDWMEFEIDASEHGGTVSHPVRARVFQLPGNRRLLVGTDILERKRLGDGVGHRSVRGARGTHQLQLQPACAPARERGRHDVRKHHARRPVAAPGHRRLAR